LTCGLPDGLGPEWYVWRGVDPMSAEFFKEETCGVRTAELVFPEAVSGVYAFRGIFLFLDNPLEPEEHLVCLGHFLKQDYKIDKANHETAQ
jgi:hypothetical protein